MLSGENADLRLQSVQLETQYRQAMTAGDRAELGRQLAALQVAQSMAQAQANLAYGLEAALPLTLRKTFADTAAWEPAARTDAAGKASIRVKLPDNLTTWRATARGHRGSVAGRRGEGDAGRPQGRAAARRRAALPRPGRRASPSLRPSTTSRAPSSRARSA